MMCIINFTKPNSNIKHMLYYMDSTCSVHRQFDISITFFYIKSIPQTSTIEDEASD